MNKNKPAEKTIRVVELFAGVGGFRVGLERVSGPKASYRTVWANQWEPASGKNQHAAWTYRHAFFRGPDGILDEKRAAREFSNEDINAVVSDSASICRIPHHDLLTGGFPCQDYSVARPKNQAAGLEGKKGVLWWSIYRILEDKIARRRPVKYVFLENVDRLLKSPSSCRGRDFAVILSCLNRLGYAAEWRVVNAGDYGLPQRRRRTYILGYYRGTEPYRELKSGSDRLKWLTKNGLMAEAFPVAGTAETSGSFLLDEPYAISERFCLLDRNGAIDDASPFQNSGVMFQGRVWTAKTVPNYRGKSVTLGNVIDETDESAVSESFYIDPESVQKWEEQKAGHRLERISKDGHRYTYSEGPLPFPDRTDRSSRTIITSEGGKSPSRFKHVISLSDKKTWPKKTRKIDGTEYRYRRLTPEELEALCMFDRGHTKWMCAPDQDKPTETPDTKRAFFMGNALVVGAVERIGRTLLKRM